ncbi:MAG: hypothetical protein U9N49_03950 [Campylobacterota bacterium]|nr:hypothetical protein [Campylobacterota bacterium]
MTLTQTELDQFYKIQLLLFAYANQRNNFTQKFEGVEEFFEIELQDKVTIREWIYQEKAWFIDEFIDKHREHLSDDDIEVARSWKDQIKDRFFILKQLKKYAKMLTINDNEHRAYGVYGLTFPFDEFFEIPTIVETVLLPYKDKITYDGFMLQSNIYMGASLRQSLNETLKMSEAQLGLITTLPYIQSNDKQAEKLLTYYAKTQSNREMYAKEIDEILSLNPHLMAFYYQEVGKSNARVLSKSLRVAGVESGYFAILSNVIVASGATQKALQANIQAIVPPDRQAYIYVYQLRKKKT